jgi:benzodiazapine receptor
VIEMIAARWTVLAVAIASVTIVAVAGGLLTEVGPWYESLRFPSLRPPNWLFGPAWTVIFLLIAISGAMAWERAPDESSRAWLIGLFAVNGVLNVVWSGLFFKLRRPDWAMLELIVFWLSILALEVFIARISELAAAVFTPYLAWVTFAGWLNLRVVQLNRPFARRSRG